MVTTASDASSSLSAMEEIRRNWPLLIATFVAFCCGAGAQTHWMTVIAPSLVKARHWTFAEVSGWKVVSCFATMAISPAVGWMADRGQARLWTLWGTLLLAVSTAEVSVLSSNLPQFYVAAFVFGIFTSVEIAYFRILVGTFHSARGLALGVVFAGSDLGAMLIPRSTLWAVDQYGVGGGYLLAGAFTLFSLPILYWGVPKRANAGQRAHMATAADGFGMREACRSLSFWLLAVATFLSALTLACVLFLIFPYLSSNGMSRVQAASYLGVLGLFALLGKIVFGGVIDRLPPAAVCTAIAAGEATATALIALRPETVPWSLPLLGFCYGAGLPCKMYLVPRLFGVRHYGVISGFIGIGSALGYAFGPLLVSLISAAKGFHFAYTIVAMLMTPMALIYLYFGVTGAGKQGGLPLPDSKTGTVV